MSNCARHDHAYGNKARHLRGLYIPILAAILSVAAGVIMPASPASAKATQGEAVRMAETRTRLLEMAQAGATDTQIQAALGLVKVSTDDLVLAPLSTSSAVNVNSPTIYYDPGIQKYYVSTAYSWKSQTTDGDGGGGWDSFGVRFSQDVVNYGASASICPGAWHGTAGPPWPAKPACLVPSAWENSEDGVLFKYVDTYLQSNCSGTDYPSCKIYRAANGNLVYTFRRLGTGCLQVFNTYAHTWSSTTISSASVNNSSFTVNFTSTTNRWQASGATSGKLGCP